MYKCKYCGKEFEKASSVAAHTSHCKLNPNKKRNDTTYSVSSLKAAETAKQKRIVYRSLNPYKYELKNFTCTCNKCGDDYNVLLTQEQFDKGKYRKTCSSSCANNRAFALTEDVRQKISNSLSSYYKNEYEEKVKNGEISKYGICEKCGNSFLLTPIKNGNGYYKRRFCKDCYSVFCKENYEKNIGNTHFLSGRYHGIQCDSSWELAFVVYNIEHGISIKRSTTILRYFYNNDEHLYFPDFDIDGQLYEIKGYENDKAKIKHETFPNVEYINGKKIKPYLKYVIDKYGKDFAKKLYD